MNKLGDKWEYDIFKKLEDFYFKRECREDNYWEEDVEVVGIVNLRGWVCVLY